MLFRVGQKVTRFRNRSSYHTLAGDIWPARIKMGGIYTIRDVDTRAAAFGWLIGLRFEEYNEEPWDASEFGLGMWEPVFPADCFRPVVERKTSIEIFTKMLTDQNAGVNA